MQTIEFRAPTGLSLTTDLYYAGNDASVASSSGVAETGRVGTYTTDFTVATGEYQLIAKNGVLPIASYWVKLGSSGTYQSYEFPPSYIEDRLSNLPTTTEFNARTLPSGDYFNSSDDTVTVGVVSSGAVQDIWETYVMAESYPATGVTATPAQIMYFMKQAFTEFDITGTTISVKKLDGSTEAFTFTMDSASSPTSRTRAT